MIKEGIHIGGIYQHYKKGDYYKVVDVAYHHEYGQAEGIVIYHRCDKNGVFQSIREVGVGGEGIIQQPFYRLIQEFTEPCKVSVTKVDDIAEIYQYRARFQLVKT